MKKYRYGRMKMKRKNRVINALIAGRPLTPPSIPWTRECDRQGKLWQRIMAGKF